MARSCATSLLATVLVVLASAQGSRAVESDPERSPHRIVSTAPNLTEILFGLGLGDRIIGVSDFCTYPEEARRKPKIGGFVDTSIEAIVALKPDLVVLLESNGDSIRKLDALHVPTLVVRDESLADIREAVRRIGERCGAQAAAQRLLTEWDALVQAVPPREGAIPRVLVCFGRIESGGQPSSFYVGAVGSLYDELVALAGGQTAVPKGTTLYPQVSVEGMYAIDPDLVIELTGAGDPGFRGRLTGDLGALSALRAVREGHWRVVEGEWAVRPGPRILQLVEPIAREIQAWRRDQP